MEVNFGMSLRRASTVPAGNLAKAASVGAKTVKGPAPVRVLSKPQAVTAATMVIIRSKD
jgi:hypothetical protein